MSPDHLLAGLSASKMQASYGAQVEVPRDAAPLPQIWNRVSVAGVMVGLALVACSGAAPTAVQGYSAPVQTGQVLGVGAAAARMPALAATAPVPRAPHTAPTATTSGAASAPSTPSAAKGVASGGLRAVGWMTAAAGAMLGVCVLLWNQMSAANRALLESEEGSWAAEGKKGLVALSATAMAMGAAPATASEMRLPPLDTDPNRCERAKVGNTIGQANAVADKLLDLRYCDLTNQNFNQTTLSGALMVETDFSNSTFVEGILSKVYAVGAKFQNADFNSAVLDRGDFDGADLSGAKFYNAVITGATFKDANLANTSFEDALIGGEDAKRLCANPTLTGDSRDEVGCRS